MLFDMYWTGMRATAAQSSCERELRARLCIAAATVDSRGTRQFQSVNIPLTFNAASRLPFPTRIVHGTVIMPQPNLKSDNYYEVLGVPKNANDAQLKKAYRKLAVKVSCCASLHLTLQPPLDHVGVPMTNCMTRLTIIALLCL